MMELNEFIKARRKALGLSLQEVGDSINYTPQAIRKFETGDVKIDIRLVGKLIEILNVSLDCFLNADIDHIEEYKEIPPFEAEKFTARLKFLREKVQITQADFANELNINKTRVSKLENGESFPNTLEFIKIANFYHVNYEELYSGIIEKKVVVQEATDMVDIVKPKKRSEKSSVFLIMLLILSNILLLTTSLVFGLTSINNVTTTENNGSKDDENNNTLDNYHEVTYYFDLSGEEIKEYVYHGKTAKNLIYRHEGYELEGYYLNDQPFDFSTPINSDIKITGKLNKKSFNVKFYNDKGVLVTEEEALYLDKVEPPILPQIPNKRFMKRNSEEYLSVKKDLSIFPIYNSYETKAFLNLNGGSFIDPNYPLTIDNFYFDDLYNLPKIIKKGYKFIEFRYNNKPINENTIFDDVVTLDAIYEANTYTISFYDCYLPELTVKYDEEVHLPRTSSDESRIIERYYIDEYDTLEFDFIYNFDHDIGLTPIFSGSKIAYSYSIKNKTAEITSIEDDTTTLYIPSVIDDFTVDKIKKGALKDNNSIKHLVIESETVQIESGAFDNLPNLISVDIGNLNGKSKLNEDIFINCPKVKYVRLGNPLNVKTKTIMRIGEYGFVQNGDVTVELSDQVKVLPIEFNRDFGKIKKLITGDGLKEIAKKHFNFDTLELEEFVPGKRCMNINLWLDENFNNKEIIVYSRSDRNLYSDVPIKLDRLVLETRSYFYPTCNVEVDEFVVQGNDCSGKDENLWVTLCVNSKIIANKVRLGSKLNIVRAESNEEPPIFYPYEDKTLNVFLFGANTIPDYLNDKNWLGNPEKTKIFFANSELKITHLKKR